MRHKSPVRLDVEMDGRVARTRAAVIRTATDLLVEGGPSAVTIDAIVARSGVAKSTIYRHWESRDDVLIAVIEECAPVMEPCDASLGFERSLRRLASHVARTLTDPEWTRIVPALLMLKSHQAGIANIEQRIEHKQDETFAAVIQLGIEEGHLAADEDATQAAAQIFGPLLFAQLTGKPPITEQFAQKVVDDFLRSRARHGSVSG